MSLASSFWEIMETSFHENQRVSYDSLLCTVRYVGSVEGTEGAWLGVEWDDPRRGKHSGTHKGKRYFKCKDPSPVAGSFVRPSRRADSPLSFLQGLNKKYASGGNLETDDASKTSRIQWGGKVVEEVGFDKIRRIQARLQELKIVLLDGLCIRGVGVSSRSPKSKSEKELDDIGETCQSIRELDLSRNLIEDWREIVEICGRLPVLRSLRLNGNRFMGFGEADMREVPCPTDALAKIEELELDNTLLTWSELQALLSHFISLQTLSFSFNYLERLNACPLSQALASISLEYNNITRISALQPLTQLSSLKSLHLRGNQISRVDETPGPGAPMKFPEGLAVLDLSYNLIADWEFIDALNQVFPGLLSLRVSNNPLFENSKVSVEESYMLTLARVPSLRTLNFSTITQAERTDAELHYLAIISRQLSASSPSLYSSILLSHPRYVALCALHGTPTITRIRQGAGSKEDNFMERFIAVSCHFDKDVKEKVFEVPRAWTVYQFKALLGRTYTIRPIDLRCIWETDEKDPVRDADGRWGESDSEEDEENSDNNRTKDWTNREVEIEDGTREMGFWVEGKQARVRIEKK